MFATLGVLQVVLLSKSYSRNVAHLFIAAKLASSWRQRIIRIPRNEVPILMKVHLSWWSKLREAREQRHHYNFSYTGITLIYRFKVSVSIVFALTHGNANYKSKNRKEKKTNAGSAS